MIKIFKNIFLLALLAVGVSSTAQNTTSSPYSQFGLGDLKGPFLPQNRAMGGLSMGVRKPSLYDNINFANPASYSTLALTTFDVGAATDLRKLSKAGISGKNQFNATLSHITFGIPVSKSSAISFGLVPYTNLGYGFTNSAKIDTTNVQYVYDGEGGISKAYMGYGFKIGKKLSLGFNVGYLFGSLKENRAVEFIDALDLARSFNSRTQYQQSVGGLSIDYGLQYAANLNDKTKLILGYAGNAGKDLNSKNNTVTTRYRIDLDSRGERVEQSVADSTFFSEGSNLKIRMPLSHTAGFAFEKTNSWLIGADVSYSKWSDYREGTVDPGFNNSYGVVVGGQLTPDATSVSNYWKLVDYRLGLKYDRTFVKIRDNDIKQYALTFGFGFPLPSNRSSFYKINLSTEIGQRGTEKNNLVRDRYININLGFLLNDKWFQKTYIE